MAERKRQAETTFAALVADGETTPEGLILDVMNGQWDNHGKGMTLAQKQRYDAAVTLLPFRLPRLNNIDAVQRNLETTHEEWLRQMDEGNADKPASP